MLVTKKAPDFKAAAVLPNGEIVKDFELSRNNLAWFAFETIAQEIYHEMEEAAEF